MRGDDKAGSHTAIHPVYNVRFRQSIVIFDVRFQCRQTDANVKITSCRSDSADPSARNSSGSPPSTSTPPYLGTNDRITNDSSDSSLFRTGSKGYRMPAVHRRWLRAGGRHPISLRGGNRGGRTGAGRWGRIYGELAVAGWLRGRRWRGRRQLCVARRGDQKTTRQGTPIPHSGVIRTTLPSA